MFLAKVTVKKFYSSYLLMRILFGSRTLLSFYLYYTDNLMYRNTFTFHAFRSVYLHSIGLAQTTSNIHTNIINSIQKVVCLSVAFTAKPLNVFE